LQADAQKLKHFEERFGAQKQVLANVTREFGTLVPPDPKKVADKAARKTAETDTKTLQVLAKWSRDLVTSHAGAVKATDDLKELLNSLVPPNYVPPPHRSSRIKCRRQPTERLSPISLRKQVRSAR